MTTEFNYSLASPTPLNQPTVLVARASKRSSSVSLGDMHADLIEAVLEFVTKKSETGLVQPSSAEATLPFQMHAAMLATFRAGDSALPSTLLRHFQPIAAKTHYDSAVTSVLSFGSKILSAALYGQATKRLSDPNHGGGEGMDHSASLSSRTSIMANRSTDTKQLLTNKSTTVSTEEVGNDDILRGWPLPTLSPETLSAAASWRTQQLKSLGLALGSSLDDFWAQALISIASTSQVTTSVPTFRELELPLWASALGTPPHLVLALLSPPPSLLALQNQRTSATAITTASPNTGNKSGGSKLSGAMAAGYSPSTLTRSHSSQEREARWEAVSTRLQNLQVGCSQMNKR